MRARSHGVVVAACMLLVGCTRPDERKVEYDNRLHLSNLVHVNDVKMEVSADTKVSGDFRVRVGTDSPWFTFVPIKVGKHGEATFIEMSGGFTFYCTPSVVSHSELLPKVSEADVDVRMPRKIESIEDVFRACQVRATDEVRAYLQRYDEGHEKWADELIPELAGVYPHPLLISYSPKKT